MTAAVCVVQARMGSSRLPGKVLEPIAGRPSLALQLARLRHGGLDVVVATSQARRDDPVEQVASSLGVPVVRGSEEDVLGRVRAAADLHPAAAAIVRLTADCPFTDPAVVRRALQVHAATSADHTGNTLQRTYPDGFDVEVLSRRALDAAADEAAEPAEREHVTPFVIRRPRRFRLATIGGPGLGHVRLTLDTADDLALLRQLADRVDDPVGAPLDRFLPDGAAPVRDGVVPVADDGLLGARAFRLLRAGVPVATGLLDVDDGAGVLRLAGVAAADRSALVDGVRGWLRMDAQVTRLEVDPA